MKIFTYFLAIALGITFSINAIIPDELEELHNTFSAIKKEHEECKTKMVKINAAESQIKNTQKEIEAAESQIQKTQEEIEKLKKILHDYSIHKDHIRSMWRFRLNKAVDSLDDVVKDSENNNSYNSTASTISNLIGLTLLSDNHPFLALTSLALPYVLDQEEKERTRYKIENLSLEIDLALKYKHALKPNTLDTFEPSKPTDPENRLDATLPGCSTRHQLERMKNESTKYKKEIQDIYQKVTAECHKRYDALEKLKKDARDK